jgi:hypothetical protein
MTHWRMRKEPGFPAGINILGTEYHYEDELEAFEESRRRRREPEAASEAKTEVQ